MINCITFDERIKIKIQFIPRMDRVNLRAYSALIYSAKINEARKRFRKFSIRRIHYTTVGCRVMAQASYRSELSRITRDNGERRINAAEEQLLV